MATLLELRTDVRSWLATSTVRLPDADLTAIINSSIADIARNYDLRWVEAETAVSLVAGTSSYALPTSLGTFSRAFYAFLIDPNDTTQMITLNQIPYEEFRARHGITTSNAQGTPEDWTILGNALELRVGPTPDTSITMEMDYFYIPTALAADNSSNTLTINARDLVLYRALTLASQFIMEDERAMMFDQMFRREATRCLSEQNRSKYSAMSFPQMTEPH